MELTISANDVTRWICVPLAQSTRIGICGAHISVSPARKLIHLLPHSAHCHSFYCIAHCRKNFNKVTGSVVKPINRVIIYL